MLQEERFNTIFMRCMPLIRVIARGYRISSADIDDIVQDVFGIELGPGSFAGGDAAG